METVVDDENARALQGARDLFLAEYHFDSYRKGKEKPKEEPKEKPKLKKSSSDPNLSSPDKGRKKVVTSLVEGSASALVAEDLKKIFDSPRQESKKFGTNLFEVSPSDGQEMKDLNTELSESSSYEKEPAPNFLAFCKGQGTPRSFIEDLELSIAKELTDTWSARIDLSRAKIFHYASPRIKAEDIWGDDEDDDSSVDEELLNEYLARLDAKDQTKKEEVMVDLILKDVKNYHGLTTSEKRDWIALQFISRRYYTCVRDFKPQPPPLSGELARPLWVCEESYLDDSDEEESDEEESDEELDLNT